MHTAPDSCRAGVQVRCIWLHGHANLVIASPTMGDAKTMTTLRLSDSLAAARFVRGSLTQSAAEVVDWLRPCRVQLDVAIITRETYRRHKPGQRCRQHTNNTERGSRQLHE
jgi:hypothetical protein